MSRLLGAIAEQGSTLDSRRLWRAATACDRAQGARIWARDLSTRKVLPMNQSQQSAADCAFLLPDSGQEEMQDGILVGLDGILYNLRELAQQSEGRRHEPCNPATGVIRRCYQRWGASCFSRFRGSFVCAILDLHNNKLLLARDHLGSKSVFFSTRCGFYFASTIQSVLEVSGSPRTVNPSVLREWLLDAPSGDPAQTFFDGIVRLPPATTLELDLSGPMVPSITEYWSLDGLAEQRFKRDEAEERLRTLLDESVELSTRDVGTVGITLSGGLDSSVLLATLRKCKGESYPVHSFTAVSNTRLSQMEERAAGVVSQLCRSQSHLVGYDCRRIPGEVDGLLANLEEPIASPVLFSHRELYRAAHAAGVRAVLNGHGSDNLFAGSNSHLVTVAASLCRRGKALSACTMLANAASGYRRMQLFRSTAGAGLPPRLKAVLRPRSKPEWMNQAWFEERKAASRNGVGRHAGTLRGQLIRELRAYSLPHTLRVEESASQAYSISGRSPFLAPEVVEFALSLPEEFLIGRDGYTKSIVRSASADLLPATIRESRERIGFPVPAAEWLRSLLDWAAEMFAEIRQLPFVDACKVQKLWMSFQRSDGRNWHQAMFLWRLIFLVRWAQVLRTEF